MTVPFVNENPMPPKKAKTNGTPVVASNTGTKPVVLISPDEREVADEALAALVASQVVFQRGGVLVHVVPGRQSATGIRRPYGPRISRLPLPRLRELLSDAVAFVSSKGPAHVPKFVVQAIDAREHWDGIPTLDALVEQPVLLPDGTVLQEPGYSNGILYQPNAKYGPIPEAPTQADARAAVAELKAVVADFPFEAPEHRSVWLAALLTPFVLFAIEDCVPLVVIDASVRGAGKTLLADILALIVTGRGVARMTHTRNEEEERKRITSLAMCGDNIVLIDNVIGELGGQSLDAVLTGKEWRDRVLGGNRIIKLPLDILWLATGNNIVLGGDTPRRALYLRLAPRTDKPESRDDFKHKNLRSFVRKIRPQLVGAALTILRAYITAGMPDMGLEAWGSFEEWSRFVRGSLVWAGEPDPYAGRDSLREAVDRDVSLLAQLLAGFEELVPPGTTITTSEMLERLGKESSTHSKLSAAVRELTATPLGQLPDARTLGNKLRAYRGRYLDGRALERGQVRSSEGATWTIVRLQPGSATAGDVSVASSASPRASGSVKRGGAPGVTTGRGKDAQDAQDAPAQEAVPAAGSRVRRTL